MRQRHNMIIMIFLSGAKQIDRMEVQYSRKKKKTMLLLCVMMR